MFYILYLRRYYHGKSFDHRLRRRRECRFPGTGTPEAGGVRFTDLLSAALRTIRGCRIVGCDMVELSPPLDPSGASTATALKLLREMLLALEKPYIQE